MIKTNSPAIAGTKYVSATDVRVGVGAVVAAGAFITSKAVCEYDPPVTIGAMESSDNLVTARYVRCPWLLFF